MQEYTRHRSLSMVGLLLVSLTMILRVYALLIDNERIIWFSIHIASSNEFLSHKLSDKNYQTLMSRLRAMTVSTFPSIWGYSSPHSTNPHDLYNPIATGFDLIANKTNTPSSSAIA